MSASLSAAESGPAPGQRQLQLLGDLAAQVVLRQLRVVEERPSSWIRWWWIFWRSSSSTGSRPTCWSGRARRGAACYNDISALWILVRSAISGGASPVRRTPGNRAPFWAAVGVPGTRRCGRRAARWPRRPRLRGVDHHGTPLLIDCGTGHVVGSRQAASSQTCARPRSRRGATAAGAVQTSRSLAVSIESMRSVCRPSLMFLMFGSVARHDHDLVAVSMRLTTSR